MTTGTDSEKALHWLMVGYVSSGAKEWIEEAGGIVKQASEEPMLIAVGLAYNPKGCWTWSKGRQEHREGIEFWSTGEIQEASTGITLQYGNALEPRSLAEYRSADSNYLILPDEEFDPATGKIAEPGAYVVKSEPAAAAFSPFDDDDQLGDLDDHPF